MISVFFKTYGCQANVADSEGIMNYLRDLGCIKVEAELEADLIFVNTCAVRKKAEDKVFSYLGQLLDLKKEKPYLCIGVIGCVASYRGKEILERFTYVNFVHGAKEDINALQGYLLDVITKLQTTKQLFLENDRGEIEQRDKVSKNSVLMPATRMLARMEVKRAFINIMTGCNNYCSFCIVPFTRGIEKSFIAEEIIKNVTAEVHAGAKEITLIGQNVNSYRCPQSGTIFAGLLEQIAQIPGVFWVRYVSPHPKDMTVDVLEVMAKYKNKLCSWIHLPLQSGDDAVLVAMNRTYTVERYMEIVGWIRTMLPEATISTDIIVGFPGESFEAYMSTRELMERIGFDFVFSFIYSRRKYTKAYRMEDACSLEEKTKRLEALQYRQKTISLERNSRLIGQQVIALVEKRLSLGKLLARTSGNIRVTVCGQDAYIGSFVKLIITGASPEGVSAFLIEI
ncbi:MAG TPA: tRNA (N6-isopentenyl adenosine(37)-C2)-methylthiotransferase MiaB [Candidatus Babeliales bacterium]|nr:tRNA (N6-isopentenyl adenosine(37)-C2)-methylthiotransferase MiaB [Candidatus Babeliales bacterium]